MNRNRKPTQPARLRCDTTHRAAACILLGTALLVPSFAAATEETEAGAFRSKLEKWVEVRQIISKEQSDWRSDRELLAETRDFLSSEKQALAAEIKELRASSSTSDTERADLLAKSEELQAGHAALAGEIRALEEKILAVAPQLPAPLREKIEMLLVQIPDDPNNTKLQLGQRLMSVLGVLAQAERFNGSATLVGETRPIGEQKLQVRTLYWGLGTAIYVDAQGQSAGVGRPGANGWVFENVAGFEGAAKQVVDIYEGNVDEIKFIAIPYQADASLEKKEAGTQ